MNTTSRWYARMLFRLKIHETSGDAYQLLFSSVMTRSKEGFRSIQAWGNWGDGGNDGWIPNKGHYYQIYAPKPTTKITAVSAAKKSVADFSKLIAKWGEIKKYTFVMNDRFEGIPSLVDKKLKELKEKYKLEDACSFNANHLLEEFMSLDEDIRMEIAGYYPNKIPDYVDSRAVGELLTHLAEKPNSDISFTHDTAPEFDKKIAINGLSEECGKRITTYSYQVETVDNFFQSSEAWLKQSIAQELKQLYLQSKEEFPDDLECAADMRYFWMVQSLMPVPMVQNPLAHKAYSAAAELILAKYFETCDIYEHPNNANST